MQASVESSTLSRSRSLNMTSKNIDLTNSTCDKCKVGAYVEKYIYDDIDGTLHCDKCNHKVNRYAKGIDDACRDTSRDKDSLG